MASPTESHLNCDNQVPLIDTHAHLTHDKFSEDIIAVRLRAEEQGVRSVLAVSENEQDAYQVLSLASRHSQWIHPAIGLHPVYVSTLTSNQLSQSLSTIRVLATEQHHILAAIGEAGLDFTPHVLSQSPTLSPHDTRATQRFALHAQLTLASELSLPLTLHSRGAGHHVLNAIEQTSAQSTGPLVVAMHAFDGRPIYAERALDNHNGNVHLYFSVPTSLVRDSQMQTLVRRLPLHCLLLESDAPALPAVRGNRAEPADLVNTVHSIAILKRCAPEIVRRALFDNTMRAFPRLRPSRSL